MTALIIIGVGFIFIYVIWMAVHLDEEGLKDDWQIFILKLILSIGILCFSIGLGLTCAKGGNTAGYKDGQVDALNGKFKYERRFAIPENDTVITDTLYIRINL